MGTWLIFTSWIDLHSPTLARLFVSVIGFGSEKDFVSRFHWDFRSVSPFISVLLICGSVGIALSLCGLVGLIAFGLDHERRIRRLEKHQARHNGIVDATENLVPKFLEAKRAYEVMGAHLANWEMKFAHIRNGGDPEAPWKDVVQWHNEQHSSKPHAK